MQHQCANNRSAASWPSIVLSVALLAAALPETLAAQAMSLASPERVKGAPRVVEVRNEPTPEDVKAARTAYQRGNIVRLSNASDEMIHRIAKGAVTVKHKEPDLSKKPADGRAVKMLKTEIGERSTAFRIDNRGVLHQITTEIAKDTPPEVRAKVEAGYREWEAKQSLADTPQQPDQGYWTPMLSKVYQNAGSWGTTQDVVTVFRLNENDTSADYYMVITDPTVTPNVKTDVASSCYYLAQSECGWWTSHRDIQISTSPAGILLSHGPNTPISTTTVSWSLGGVLSFPPGLTGAYTETWNQDSVNTADQSSTQNGVGHWVETFSEIQEFKTLPDTAVSVFVSHQGAILQMPDRANFTLNVLIGTTLHYYAPNFTSGTISAGGGGTSLSVNLTPPELALTQNFTTIAPGGNGSMQVFADIFGGDAGLDWVISNVPPWASVTQLTGTGTTAVGIQVAPGTPLGTTGTLNVDLAHVYASPSTVRGPLKFEIKVGQPDLHGALLIGGARFRSGSYDALGSGLFYSAAANDFVASTALNQARSYHTSTPLLDGTILVAGGRDMSDPKSSLASAEIYDPSTASFIPLSNSPCPGPAGCMITPAWNRVATRLSDGRVLITGGTSDGVTCTQAAEVYDPSTKTFSAVGNMAQARCAHSAELVHGKVLVGGGVTNYSLTDAVNPAGWELFDPGTGLFVPKSIDQSAGWDRTATPLSNGVLLVGGFGGHPGQQILLPVMGVYNDTAITAITESNSQIPRVYHTATKLQDGRVLITGGRARRPFSAEFYTAASAEIYDPAADPNNAVTLLSGSGTCPGASGCMLSPRAYHTATLLLDGRVLLSGGVGDDASAALTTTEIYDPKTNTFSAGPQFDGRVSHTSVQLRAPSSITLQDPGPQTAGTNFNLVARVNVPYPNTLSGSVEFSSGDMKLGSKLLSNGAASVTVKLPEGKYPVIAKYSGSDSFAPSASDAVIVQVSTAPTSMKLTSSASSSPVGQNVTFTAVLQANGPVPPTGTVRFLDAGSEMGSVPVTQGQAQFTTNALSAGTHTITAAYSGDANYQPDNSDAITQTVTAISTHMTLASSASPSAVGAPVTFTANVIADVAGKGTPSGDVTFADGSNPLAAVSLVDGTARYTTSTLTQGDHKISVTYQGDKIFAASPAISISQSVGASSTTTSLAPVKNPIVYGQDPVALTVTVTGQGGTKASGTVNLLEGTNTLASGTLDSNGQATLTVAAGLGAGIHQLTASYAGNSSFAASTSQNVALTVDHAPTTTALALSTTNVTVGQSVTLTATVQGPGSKQTGTVTFLDGSKTVGTAELNAGTASAPISNFTQGSHSLTAVYRGDTNYSSSTSSAVALTVQATPTTATLVSSANPASLGDGITLTATVTGAGGTPTGKVAISRGGVQVGLLDLVSGSAPFVVSGLTPGTYNFTANYQGDSSFAASNSNTVSQVINRANATITLTSSLNPSPSKTSVTFTATIQGLTSLPPSGSLTFLDGTTSLGVGTINSGQAFISTNVLTVGSHNITASYAGDDNYASATSAVLVQGVNSAAVPSTTVVTSSKNPSSAGETVGFVVRVQGQSPGPNTPTGTVTLMEGATSLGSAVLSNGSATIPIANLSVGSHTITASYGGDSNFSPSTSAPITQTVNATPTSSITVSSQTNPSIAGAPVTFAATVTSNNGTPSGTVTFQDGGAAIGTANLVNGTAMLTAPNLTVGTHSITAVYAGDGTYPAATSAAIQQQVNRASSSVRLTSDANPSNVNQQVTFQAVVTSSYQALTGTVTFLDGATALGTVPLTSGSATFRTSTLSGGAHNITASYSGDANVLADTSSVYTQQVNTLFPTTITLRSTQNPSIEGQQVMFAIDVTSTGGGVPAGTVTLSESLSGGAIIYGSASLTNGSATITVEHLPAGVHQIYATYGGESGGNPTHTGATSLPVQQVVNSSTSTNR